MREIRINSFRKRKIFLIMRRKLLRFLLTVGIIFSSLNLVVLSPISAEYLHITDPGFTVLPTSARAMGMGDTFVAVADDYSASYFNPAGLMQITQKEVGTMYVDLYSLGLLTQSFLSFVEPDTGMGAGGISWTHLSADLEPEKWDYDIFFYSYGQSFFRNKSIGREKVSGSWGTNIKYLTHTTSWGNATGYSLDLGFLIWGKRLSAGLNIQDLISQIEWDTQKKEVIPPNIKVGVAYRFNPSLLLALDMNGSQQDFLKDIRVGGEWWVKSNMALRLGIVKISQGEELNLSGGFGFYLPIPEKMGGKILGIEAFSFDYAFSYKNLGNTHRFSFSFNF